jgi:hypothetical protein
MTGQCGGCGRTPRRLARPLSRIIVSILPAAVTALLPKCPLCLAVWLTFATGISVSATAAAWLRGMMLLLSAIAVLLLVIGRRPFGRAPAFLRRLH